jgi:hypothetical protein
MEMLRVSQVRHRTRNTPQHELNPVKLQGQPDTGSEPVRVCPMTFFAPSANPSRDLWLKIFLPQFMSKNRMDSVPQDRVV